MRHEFTRIIKAYPTILSNPSYFDTNEGEWEEDVQRLKEQGWLHVECKAIHYRDPEIMRALNHCSNGSKRENANLRIIFNDN